VVLVFWELFCVGLSDKSGRPSGLIPDTISPCAADRAATSDERASWVGD
jgi:hypothetical protein